MSYPQAYSDGSQPKVAIIGAGFCGILMSLSLKRRLNITDFIVFEGDDDVGGTWHVNTYPGCACDVTSHLYSYYDHLNSNWSESYSTQEEIKEYLSNTTDKWNIRKNILFNTWVTRARFNTEKNKWELKYKNKVSGQVHDMEVDILIGCVGYIRIPNIPKEFAAFDGPCIHSAKWDHSIDLTNKTVGIVGSGASAVQIVPSIVDQVGELHVFQRSPPYVIPKFSQTYPNWLKRFLNWFPFLQRCYYWILFFLSELLLVGFFTGSWIAKATTWINHLYINFNIQDPMKRARMMPKYHIGCKRITPSSTYYQAINRSKVVVHDGNINRIDGRTIHLRDGTSQTVDILILATGFESTSPYKDMDIANLDGDHIDAHLDSIDRSPRLHYGITASEVPNFFMTIGPTTNVGNNSAIFFAECQANYIVSALGQMMAGDVASIDLKPTVGDAYWAWVQRRVRPMVWHGNCKSWYQNSKGEVVAMWPGTGVEYYFKTLKCNLVNYDCRGKPGSSVFQESLSFQDSQKQQ